MTTTASKPRGKKTIYVILCYKNGHATPKRSRNLPPRLGGHSSQGLPQPFPTVLQQISKGTSPLIDSSQRLLVIFVQHCAVLISGSQQCEQNLKNTMWAIQARSQGTLSETAWPSGLGKGLKTAEVRVQVPL